MDLKSLQHLTNQAQRDEQQRQKEAHEAWVAAEPARKLAAAAAEQKALELTLAEFSSRMEALARVGKQSCYALVGHLPRTFRNHAPRNGVVLDPARCREVQELRKIYLVGEGPNLSEGIGDVSKYKGFLSDSAGIVAGKIYDHCKKAGFNPRVSCTDRSTGETWLVITLSW